MILISNDRISASKKINGMALIRTLMGSTTAFERTKEKFYGFRQAALLRGFTVFYLFCSSIVRSPTPDLALKNLKKKILPLALFNCTVLLKATITRCDLSPRFFCTDATLFCEFESDKI